MTFGLGLTGLFLNTSALSGSGSVAAATTWATAADWTLTNGNLTAERTGTTVFNGLIKTVGTSTNGTIIFTIVAAGATTEAQVGLATTSFASPNRLGLDNEGFGLGYSQDGQIKCSGGTMTTVATYTTGDVIKFIPTGAAIAIYKNNTLLYTTNPTTQTPNFTGAKFGAATSANALGFKITIDTSAWV